MENNKQATAKLIRLIFFIQIGLLFLITILSIIGFKNIVSNVGSFFFITLLGALGASVSLLKRARSNRSFFDKEYEKLKVFTVLMPILYGTILAGITYLLFMSGILSGDGGNGMITTNLFPNFMRDIGSDLSLFEQFIIIKPVDIQNTAKLFIWCFMAGYSESFVAGILNQLEGQVSKN
ncbi:MAG: hypothetical protein JXR05_05540 [Flavobacteriaceae bacterium]